MVELAVDDPGATTFNVADTSGMDGARATIVDGDGNAIAEATLRVVSPTTIALDARRDFGANERFWIRTAAAIEARAVRTRDAEMRPEQRAFREAVGNAWGWRCAISGEDVREVLDAAHLPGTSWRAGHNDAEHGILLRTDIHRLFERGLLRIEGGIVRVGVGSYVAFDGKVIVSPKE
jgi:hypothetical protein